MLKIKKQLKELTARIERLEEEIKTCSQGREAKADGDISYKEVIDEWLNGKRES